MLAGNTPKTLPTSTRVKSRFVIDAKKGGAGILDEVSKDLIQSSLKRLSAKSQQEAQKRADGDEPIRGTVSTAKQSVFPALYEEAMKANPEYKQLAQGQEAVSRASEYLSTYLILTQHYEKNQTQLNQVEAPTIEPKPRIEDQELKVEAPAKELKPSVEDLELSNAQESLVIQRTHIFEELKYHLQEVHKFLDLQMDHYENFFKGGEYESLRKLNATGVLYELANRASVTIRSFCGLPKKSHVSEKKDDLAQDFHSPLYKKALEKFAPKNTSQRNEATEFTTSLYGLFSRPSTDSSPSSNPRSRSKISGETFKSFG